MTSKTTVPSPMTTTAAARIQSKTAKSNDGAVPKEMSDVVNQLEGAVEKQSLSCRVFSEYRGLGMAGLAVGATISMGVGAIAALGIGIHRLATLNPDYEIGKNRIAGTVRATFKK